MPSKYPISSVHELAHQLHLEKLPDILDQIKTGKELTVIANQSFSIICKPTEVECRQWDEPGWPIILKKAFEVAVHDTNKNRDVFGLTYREETPSRYMFDGYKILWDTEKITEVLQQKEPVSKTMLETIQKYSEASLPSLSERISRFLKSEPS